MAERPIPLYRQTSEFTCGAASLVMALHALRNGPITRRQEFELWREATMIGFLGIDQWGLTIPALNRAVPATVVSEAEITFPRVTDHVRDKFSAEEIQMARFGQEENRERASAAGARWLQRPPTRDDVKAALLAGAVPVPLVDLHTLSKGADEAPHWVVIVSEADGRFLVYDPDDGGPGERRLTWDEIEEAMDVTRYGATPTLVILGP